MNIHELIHPGFWSDSPPIAMADQRLTKWCQQVPELEGHILFATSGSTGGSKWIALSKTALLLSAATVNRHLKVDNHSCWGLALPFQHVGGFGVVARSYEAASRLAIWDGKWNPAAVTKWIESHQITHLSLVPTQVHDLVVEKLRSPSCLRAIVVGGGHLSARIGQAARDLGWPVLASYGMTETGSQIATQSLESLNIPYQPAPLPLLDIWNVASGPGNRLSVSGPALFTGAVIPQGLDYNWDPRNLEWFLTGDRVEVVERNLTPLGRVDTLVKILGELVDPEAVERELVAGIVGLEIGDVYVTAVPDERAEHRLVPVFQDSSLEGLITEAWRRYNDEAAGFKRLAAPVIVSEFPRTALGKIRRAELLQMLIG